MTDETRNVKLDDDCSDGVEMCLCCLAPTRPAANFCDDCGAPLGFIGATLPFEQILAEGFILRRAVHTPRSPLTLVGILLIFGTNFLVSAAMAVVAWKDGRSAESEVALLPVLVFAGAMSIYAWGVILAARNYARFRREGAAS